MTCLESVTPLLFLSLLLPSSAKGLLSPCQWNATPQKDEVNITDAMPILGQSLKRTCLQMLRQNSVKQNFFYFLADGGSALLESEICAADDKEWNLLLSSAEWRVVLRDSHVNRPLFQPNSRSTRSNQTNWRLLPTPEPINKENEKYFCVNKNGQLRIKPFLPHLSGTYILHLDTSRLPPDLSQQHLPLSRLFHHVDLLFNESQKAEPKLAPKPTFRRRYDIVEGGQVGMKFKRRRTTEQVNKPFVLRTAKDYNDLYEPGDRRKVSVEVKRLGTRHRVTVQMVPDMRDKEWRPQCGQNMERLHEFRCSVSVNSVRRLRSVSVRAAPDQADEMDAAFAQHLLAIVERLDDMLLDESRSRPYNRLLHLSGFRYRNVSSVTSDATAALPCHWSFLRHLPAGDLDLRRLPVPSLLELAEKLCSPLNPLDFMKQLSVIAMRTVREIYLVGRRPVPPRFTILFRGKTFLLKCPIDPKKHKAQLCNTPGQQDTIAWTLNHKTLRFIAGEDLHRGPHLTRHCGLSLKNVEFNDAGWYRCYRTLRNKFEFEPKPALQHFVQVIRPDYDPPTEEDSFVGLLMVYGWLGVMSSVWCLALAWKGVLFLLLSPEDQQPEPFTSFYDDNSSLNSSRDELEDDSFETEEENSI